MKYCEKHNTMNWPDECFYCHYGYPAFKKKIGWWKKIKEFFTN